MKKVFIGLVLLLAPSLAFAQGFDADVSYGMKGDAVLEVQEFLGTQHCFSGPYTGNFYSLTLAGVKCFQKANGIPTTGYFGPLSRARAIDIVASESADNETSTTTQDIGSAPATTTPQTTNPSTVFTLPNGSVISISPDGVITTLYSPSGAHPTQSVPSQSATSTGSVAPVISVPQSSQTPPMTDSQTPVQPAQQAPFVRSGSVNASLVSQASALSTTPGRVVLLTIQVDNKTNETIQFQGSGNIQAKLQVSQKSDSWKDWAPTIAGIFKSQDLLADTTGIQPGASGTIQIFLTNTPPSAGSADFTFTGLTALGQTSGESVLVDSSYIELGVLSAQ